MDRDPDDVIDALASGDTDRVNDVIDAVDSADQAERAAALAATFERCVDLYDTADDGYVRQAVVRFCDAAEPRLGTAEAYGDPETAPAIREALAPAFDDPDEYRLALMELALTAMDDDDGRVRQSAMELLDDICLDAELGGKEAQMEPALHALDELATAASGRKREHIEEAIEQVARRLNPDRSVLSAARKLVEEAEERRE